MNHQYYLNFKISEKNKSYLDPSIFYNIQYHFTTKALRVIQICLCVTDSINIISKLYRLTTYYDSKYYMFKAILLFFPINAVKRQICSCTKRERKERDIG